MAYGFNPPGIWGPQGRAFSQGVIAGEGVTLYITGQVAWDADSNVVGPGDVAAQMHKSIENTRVILEAAGGTLEDIVSMTIYFLDRAHLPDIQDVRRQHFKTPGAPASILIQVSGLVIPELLVEIAPVALIPHKRFKRPDR
ncbi:RidA family protein [Pelagibius marinus]|uniref:RidA family protein n=1 Tax=Pelagibius marinus TaxID=2762760 RepID=UPI0018730A99|nr:RidA family protein [Pelagibius marinus]